MSVIDRVHGSRNTTFFFFCSCIYTKKAVRKSNSVYEWQSIDYSDLNLDPAVEYLSGFGREKSIRSRKNYVYFSYMLTEKNRYKYKSSQNCYNYCVSQYAQNFKYSYNTYTHYSSVVGLKLKCCNYISDRLIV